jgi:putative endonuclease
MFYTYIIFSATLNVYYKGYTSDIKNRIEYHNSGKSPYTSKSNDWHLVFFVEFKTKKEALIEEKRIKKLNRTSLEKLILGFKT